MKSNALLYVMFITWNSCIWTADLNEFSGYDSLSYEGYVSSSTKVQLNLDNPTCFFGPNFSRIILTHIYGFAARRFFPQIMRRNCGANWICKLLLSTDLNLFRAQSTINNTVHFTELWLVQICSVAEWTFICLFAQYKLIFIFQLSGLSLIWTFSPIHMSPAR